MRDFRSRLQNSRLGSGLREVYQSGVLDGGSFDGEDMEVELASPWRRLGAFALNVVLMFVFAFGISSLAGMVGYGSGYLGYFLMALYAVGQMVMMVQTGQSLGKKIMGIRVIADDGGQAGAVQYVLLREGMVCVAFLLLNFFPVLTAMLGLAAAAACIIMMFFEDMNRKTLQDILAKTLVVRDEAT